MGKIILTILLMFIYLSVSADENQTNSRNLQSLSYFPTAGQIFIMPSFLLTSASSSTDELNVLASTYSEVESKSLNTDIELGYGITDYFAFSLSGSYYFKDSLTTTYYDNTKETEESVGFTDPEITIGYRVYEGSFICDIYIAFSPKLIDAESATDNKDGNKGKGGSDIDLELAFGKNFDNDEIYCDIMYSIVGPGETKDAEDGSVLTFHGGHQFSALLAYRHRIGNFAFTLRTGYMYTRSIELGDETNYYNFSIDPTDTYIISAGIGYAIIPRQLAISAEYLHGVTYTHNVTLSGDYMPTEVYTNNRSHLNIFSISAILQY